MEAYKKVLGNRNFILMLIAMIMVGTGQMAVNNTVASYCLNNVGITQVQYGTVVSVAGLAVAFGYPFFGVICDKIRHGICGAMGAACMVIAMLLYTQANSYAMLIACRCIQFIGFGMVINVALCVSAVVGGKKNLTVAMMLYGLGPAITTFTGPQLGVTLSTNLGYTTMFRICAVLAGIGLVCFLFNTSKAEIEPNAPKRVVFGFEKSAVPAAVLSLLMLPIVFVAQSYGTLSLTERGIANAALFWSITAVVNIIARMMLPKIIDKIGSNKTFYLTVSLLAASIVLIALATNFAMVAIAGVCYGIGYNGTQAAINASAVQGCPKERIGQATATCQFGGNISQTVWSPFIGLLAGSVGYQGMFMFLLLPLAAGLTFYVAAIRGKVIARESGNANE